MTERPGFYLHHGCLAVADLDVSIDFYTTRLGFVVESRRVLPDRLLQIAFLARGDDRLELVCHEDAEPLPPFARAVTTDFRVVGTKHLSFGTDDADALHGYLSANGVPGLTDVFENNPFYRYFFFSDPDGIILEVVEARPAPAGDDVRPG